MSVQAPRGIIIAAPRSGAGKTTVTLGLLRALRQAGVGVQPFKCGPDYIDPAFHGAASGRASVNLDTWAMRSTLIFQLVHSAAADTDLCIAEGVMGLFDGAAHRGRCGKGATADLASLTGWPVILVLDVWAQSETAAAVALGCKLYRSDIEIGGVILNGVGSHRHGEVIASAIEALGLPVLGMLHRRTAITLPERHLGLVQAEETGEIDAKLDDIAAMMRSGVDLERVLALALPLRNLSDPPDSFGDIVPPGQRIALARDRVFSFVYAHLLDAWRRAGAEIVPFSPLNDEAPDTACDAIWLPGGYPELHAPALAAATTFKHGMLAAASKGMSIHGECGGYMVLGAGLETAGGARHEMLGLLGLETSFARRQLHLGYRRAALPSGGEAFGHEFHYATVLDNPDEGYADICDIAGARTPDQGARRGRTTGTFFHLIDVAG
jgi:cobyrinic acid a,c-diamide synthase